MATFLTGVARAFFQTLLPVARPFGRVSSLREFLRSAGWTTDTFDDTNIASVKQAAGVTGLLVQADNILDQLDAGGDEISLAGQLVDVLGQLLDAARAQGKTSATLPYPFSIDQFWSDLAAAIVDENVARYLEVNQPILYATARVIGLIDLNVPTDFDPGRAIVETRRLRLDRLGTVAGGPAKIVSDVYNWNNPAEPFDHRRFLFALRDALWGADVLARVRNPDPTLLAKYYDPTNTSAAEIQQLFVDIVSSGSADTSAYATFGLNVLPIPDVSKLGPPVGWVLLPAVTGILPSTPATPADAVIDFGGGFSVDGGVFFEVRPGAVSLSGGVPGASVGVTLKPVTPWVLVGTATGSRLELAQFQASLGVSAGSSTNIDFSVGSSDGANQGRFAIVIDLGQADGFVAGIVGSSPVRTEFPFTLKWSSHGGFALSSQGGLAVTIPVNRSFAGTLFIQSVRAALGASGNGASIAATVDGTVALGPVSATISGIGVEIGVSPDAPPGGRRDFGDLSTTFGFKSPTGVGVAIDAGSVHGGGFISFDPTAGRYSGALQLSIYDIAVNAFGLVDTKLPGVSYSFVIIISAEFTPIQLGLGFTLNGVGGMVGINRGIDTNALSTLVRAGQSEELLFPKNVVADAPTIVRDLTSVFPATQGRYVFGPLAKLGWGTPTLITAEIGVILEIPGPIVVILGEVKCLLPKPDAALIKLNLSVDGELDFPKKSFSLDATLHDSVINGLPVSGQMAMRLNWGGQPNFVLSIGGFHPAYTPPPNFPKLQPLALDLGSHGPATITVSGFFAVTSNTVQVGGAARLHAGGSGISLDASVSVKALFVFTPFSFEADIDASVKISFHGYGPSVHLSGVLEGPSPWHVKGEVCVSILWWDACLGFDVTFGGNQQVTQPEIDPWVGVDASQPGGPLPGLQAALSDPGNWSGAALPGAVSPVTRAQGTQALVDPVGGLTVRQKVAPVETSNPLTKFGVARVARPVSFSNVQATLGTGSPVSLTPVEATNEFFAPAQFFDMNDAKKLSSAGFESYQAGYLFATAASPKNVQAGSRAPKTLTYNTFVIGGDGTITGPQQTPPPPNDNAQVTAANTRSAVTRGGVTLAGARRFINLAFTQAFTEKLPAFVISTNTTLAVATGAPAAAARSATLIALDGFRAQHIEQAASFQVSAFHELA